MRSLLPVSCGEAKEFVRLACGGVVLAGLLASSGRGSLAGLPGTPDLCRLSRQAPARQPRRPGLFLRPLAAGASAIRREAGPSRESRRVGLRRMAYRTMRSASSDGAGEQAVAGGRRRR
jgi:hypothetical protein